MKKLRVIAKDDKKVYPDWFLKLSESAQKTYIENHPRSTPRKLWDAGIKPERIKKLKTKVSDSKKIHKETVDKETTKSDTPKNKTRKTANPKQLEQRNNVLDNLNKILKRFDKTGKTSVLGLNAVKEFKEHGASEILGKEVGSAKDLAFISQIYRNPLMETFRVVYIKDDKVVGHNTISQRLPASVSFPKSPERHIADDIKNLDADTYYIMHNHPSGNSGPSDADIKATKYIYEDIKDILGDKVDFGGHVVINHKEYSFIDHKGNVSQHDSESLEETYGERENVVNHSVLGHEITGPSALANLSAKLYLQSTAKDSITYIGANGSTSQVKLLLSIPKDILTTSYDYKKVASYIRAISKTSGMGVRRFAAIPDKFNGDNIKHYRKLLDDDIFTDITDVDGTSLRQKYSPDIPKRDVMGFKGKARFKGVTK